MKLRTLPTTLALSGIVLAGTAVAVPAQAAVTGTPTAVSAVPGPYGCNYSDGKEPQLSRGSSGRYVKQAQCLLLHWGEKLPKYGIDGDFGSETENAVVDFQKTYCGLDPDGIIGPKTWFALKHDGCS
ncbi:MULTISPECIES: peptidoglycan-binding protein [Streptomyces]|uniref:Peptidoglycan binding-like domain-containing protein n=1 Tax=Streptomyces luteosporeus TaxID=173856 RepID=A0ABN3U1G4_9ACTN